MSITSALAGALSGLSATSRQAEILSSNVANATTPGYARRQVGLGAAVLAGHGQGVQVLGVTRDVDRHLLGERRVAQAGGGDRDVRAEFLQRVEQTLGTADNPSSLAARLAAFDQALVESAGRPESQARLNSVATTAKALISGLAAATTDIQNARASADRRIGEEVGKLNSTLQQLHELNVNLRSFTGAGRDVSALLDERQRLVDQISAIVPVREIPRDLNQIALFTVGGAPLLEGSAAVIGFTPVHTITPEMTQALGGLSGISINGRPYDTAGSASPILGGTLGALFSVRDELAVGAQGKLDAAARDLVERFAGLDPTLAPGAAGLFTDGGGAFDPLDEAGLAGRLRLNPAADPAQGGALFRLRDGLGAATEGPPGNGTLLTALHSALTGARPLASTGFIAGNRSFAVLTSDILSDASAMRLSAQSEQSFSAARLTALTDLEAQNGIDTDQEMQELLVLEKNYAANAKVIQAVADMIDTLIRLDG
ncbi:MAG: flagellar hook-associated protein FlgK [Tabrizicola sp.]|uniref:flagellar hook-associated protein FlgK n=1 Tax=Tabrizicola sp. TaxID=2005166 RepID=UPI002ABB4DCF|nr:flagellar hook-associated protein FlgK [Tabrizicola sp.]MDZ4087662.1 flagellar hook-associated protein FlgK [Tabrizicola sp.]